MPQTIKILFITLAFSRDQTSASVQTRSRAPSPEVSESRGRGNPARSDFHPVTGVTSKPSVTMIRQKLLIVCLLFSLGSSQISFGGPPPEKEENKCTTPDGKEGECIGLRRCNNILVLLRKPIATEAIKYLRASVCSFSGFLPDGAVSCSGLSLVTL